MEKLSRYRNLTKDDPIRLSIFLTVEKKKKKKDSSKRSGKCSIANIFYNQPKECLDFLNNGSSESTNNLFLAFDVDFKRLTLE